MANEEQVYQLIKVSQQGRRILSNRQAAKDAGKVIMEGGVIQDCFLMYQTDPPLSPEEVLPTMYDLMSEDPEESGLPDHFHLLQPRLLDE
ncbi:MAG: hypothetical protein NWQ28_05335, partial [Nodularia sp. (in: cyanobacteria)]|nr:hypothetical protein [Nodularia sp. (in: cyanobacteria)]